MNYQMTAVGKIARGTRSKPGRGHRIREHKGIS
jgi:hypothetical protein